jgi:hypothetical protein
MIGLGCSPLLAEQDWPDPMVQGGKIGRCWSGAHGGGGTRPTTWLAEAAQRAVEHGGGGRVRDVGRRRKAW